jgi:LPXTG-motif cell wall-anchored protein
VTVTITGGVSDWSYTDPTQPIATGEWLWYPGGDMPGDTETLGSDFAVWTDDSAEADSLGLAFRLVTPTSWVGFEVIDDPVNVNAKSIAVDGKEFGQTISATDANINVYMIPDGPGGGMIAGGPRDISLDVLDLPPCAHDRSAALGSIALALPTAPSDAATAALLNCGTLASMSQPINTHFSKTVPLTLPSGVVSAGFLTDPTEVHARFSGLPAGVSAALVTTGSGLGVTFTGALASTGAKTAHVTLYRAVTTGRTTTDEDPVAGELTITGTPFLAETGESSPDGMGIVGIVLVLLGAVAILAVRRRRVA